MYYIVGFNVFVWFVVVEIELVVMGGVVLGGYFSVEVFVDVVGGMLYLICFILLVLV